MAESSILALIGNHEGSNSKRLPGEASIIQTRGRVSGFVRVCSSESFTGVLKMFQRVTGIVADEGPAGHAFGQDLFASFVTSKFQDRMFWDNPQDGSLLTEEPWEGTASDRIDFRQFIPKDIRRTGHDTAMAPEDVYSAPYYRSNVDWSVVEEDAAQEGFARVLPMEEPDPIFDGDYEPTGRPGRPPSKRGRGRGGMRGGRRWSRPLKVVPERSLDLEADVEEPGTSEKKEASEEGVLLDLDFEDPFASLFLDREEKKHEKHRPGDEEFEVLDITGDGACLYRALFLGMQLLSGIPRHRLQD